nr:AraC family transcriptional regulator [uncultured Flavobacterium sp.]
MKIEKEEIAIEPGHSFKVFSPSLKNYFFWHYHPEFELVYVEAVTGIRHVGKNISTFDQSDLVLIGSNIPHLNFDYGLEVEYKQIVVQFKEQFLRDLIVDTPEFASINVLFRRASMGLSFSGETKQKAVEKLHLLQKVESFESLLILLDILQLLASSNEVLELNSEDTSVKRFLKDKIRMGTIYNYIHQNFNKKPDVNAIASSVSLSTPAFCRYFKRQTDMTFTEFVLQYRITQAKTMLLNDISISEVAFEVGIESISYFNKVFKKLTGETPTGFRNKHKPGNTL